MGTTETIAGGSRAGRTRDAVNPRLLNGHRLVELTVVKLTVVKLVVEPAHVIVGVEVVHMAHSHRGESLSLKRKVITRAKTY
jgi:hypothetical protein